MNRPNTIKEGKKTSTGKNRRRAKNQLLLMWDDLNESSSPAFMFYSLSPFRQEVEPANSAPSIWMDPKRSRYSSWLMSPTPPWNKALRVLKLEVMLTQITSCSCCEQLDVQSGLRRRATGAANLKRTRSLEVLKYPFKYNRVWIGGLNYSNGI